MAQVAKYLYDNHRDRFETILQAMKDRVPGVTNVEAKVTEDGYVILRFQDGHFKNPFSSKFVSDGTIKMFTYLVLLSDPNPHVLLCVEEPENQLYPELPSQLAEEFRHYSDIGGQVFISTHSPDFLIFTQKKYRIPDDIPSPKGELYKLVPEHQQIEARKGLRRT